MSFALLAALFAPDADIVLGLFSGRGVMHYHNGFSHSLLVAPVFALPFGLAGAVIARGGWLFFTMAGLVAYETHVVLDAFTWGGGLQLLWPVIDEYFQMPIVLFFGVHHSEGLFHWYHLVTLLNDLTFAALVWGCATWLRRRATPTRGGTAASQ